MEKFLIAGGKRLEGKLKVHGAKNAALPILAASLLTGCSEIHNCPRLTDVDAACHILRHLGAEAQRQGETVLVKPGTGGSCCIPDELMHRMRSSIVFLGAIIARCGQARISLPGGCDYKVGEPLWHWNCDLIKATQSFGKIPRKSRIGIVRGS